MSVESYYSIGSIAIEKSRFRTAAYVGLHRAAVITIAHASAFRKESCETFQTYAMYPFRLIIQFRCIRY